MAEQLNEQQMKALRALVDKWNKYKAGSGAWTAEEAALYQGREDGHQGAAEDLEWLLESALFADTSKYRVLYKREGETVPYMSKPLARVDAEALAAQYQSQGLDVHLSASMAE